MEYDKFIFGNFDHFPEIEERAVGEALKIYGISLSRLHSPTLPFI